MNKRRSVVRCAALVAIVLAPALACDSPEAVATELPTGGREDVFVSVRGLASKLDTLTVLDGRNGGAYALGHIPGARSAPWTDFTTGRSSGTLRSAQELQTQLRNLGVSNDRRVVVVADWDKGWGEEGHLYWLLTHLGHRDVRVLYGGMPAWSASKRGTEMLGTDVRSGTFTVKPQAASIATSGKLNEAKASSTVVLDVREKAEFDGETPYGSARGGHIPGARHYYWKRVFDKSGNLRSAAALRSELAALGLDQKNAKVATYCTGGVRSGFLFTILVWLDFANASNYDGSWWEWSANSELPVEGAP